MHIMEISELKELVKMNSVSPVVATDVFKRKYGKRMVVISDSYTDLMPIFKRNAVVIGENKNPHFEDKTLLSFKIFVFRISFP